MKLDEIKNKKEILYFAPDYCMGKGSLTKLSLLQQDTIYISINVLTLLTNLCRFFAVDLLSSRRKYGNLVGSSINVPIPLTAGLVLVPLKVRNPLVKGDGAMAYVNYKMIKEAVSDNDKKNTKLIFKDNSSLSILTSYNTVQKYIINAGIINNSFDREKLADIDFIYDELALVTRVLLKLQKQLKNNNTI